MSKQAIIYRNTCRLCDSKNLRRFLHFDDIPFFDEVIPAHSLNKEFTATMDVFWCKDCYSVQSQHDVNIDSYYKDYQYVASESPFICDFMNQLAKETFQRFGMQKGDRVIDVGSADGYQLECFQKLGAVGLGFEAAENLCELSRKRGVQVTTNLFTSESLKHVPTDFNPVQAFILLHTFDHLLDPTPFLNAVKQVLDPKRGVLILEVHDLQEIIKRRETALFGHEHATFLHLVSMKRLLERQGFTLLDTNFIPENKRRGNSMLIAAGLQGCNHAPIINVVEKDYAYLDKWETYQNFENTIHRSFKHLRQAIQAKVASGKKIAGYGAWGRGVTTLAMAKLTSHDLVYMCDRNPYLHGKYTPGSQIVISPPERLFSEPPDEVIVFNYGYFEEIRQQLKLFTENGGKLISIIDLLGTTN